MSKAEERALEAYPPKFTSGKRYAKRVQSEKVDTHAPIRKIYLKGYETAEKDLALTAEDIRTIYELTETVSNHSVWAKYSSGFWDEVLKRFKEAKK